MKEMRLTGFDTIIFGDKELLLDEFFKILNNNLGENYSVYCEEDNDRFKVVFNGVEYYLVLDKITMDDYRFGNYNNFTCELKQLVDKTIEIEQDNNDEKVITKRREKIIEDAKMGLIPNNEARRVYLEYLKDNRKFSLFKIKSYFSNLIGDLKASYYCVDDWTCKTTIWPFNQMVDGIEYFCRSVLSSGVIFAFVGYYLTVLEMANGINPFEAKYLKWMLLSFLPQTTYLVPMTKFLGIQTMMRFGRLRDFVKNRRLVKYKIKQLTDELKRGSIEDKTFSTFDRTLTRPIEEQVNHFKDPILDNLGAISNRLQYINPTEREVLRGEIKQIAEDYKDKLEEYRRQRLDESSQIVLSFDNASYISIINDIVPRISAIEQRMNQIREYDVNKEQFDEEYSRVMNSIYNCSNANGDNAERGVHSKARRKLEQQ